MIDIQKQIEKFQAEAEELSDLRDDVFNVKADITVTAVGLLLKKLNGYISDMIEIASEKKYYDEGLCETLKSTVSDVITAFSKIQPVITVNPKIAVDIQPLQSIAENISNQNKRILLLIDKLNDNNNSDELMRLVTALISKQNIFLEKSFQQFDYSSQLNSIKDAVNKKVEKLTVKREEHGLRLITEIIPVYKK